MDLYDANTEYKNALKAGQREYRTLTAKGLDPHPQILEKLIENVSALPVQTIGIREIPIERIVGVKTEGRITAFSASFMPLSQIAAYLALLSRIRSGRGGSRPSAAPMGWKFLMVSSAM